MALIQCSECGNMVSDNATACNKCGAPIVRVSTSDNGPVVSAIPAPNQQPMQPRQQMPASYQQPAFITTDTGYSHEKAIKTYANICFWIFVVLVVLGDIALLATIGELQHDVPPAIVLIGVIVITPILIMLAYVSKAFLVTYANISINLHELNMKKTV